jgi:hypothetical protein
MDLHPPIPLTTAATRLPMRFHLPEGWPAPSIDWLAANQGWDPPEGWTPLPGVDPAPSGWTWWSRDEIGWKAMTGHAVRGYRIGITVSVVVLVLGVALTVITRTKHPDAGFVFWGALIFAPLNLMFNLGRRRCTVKGFVPFIRNRAADVRQALDTATYREHVELFGQGAVAFDRFLAQRGAESWSFTGRWAADQSHPGVTEQFRLPLPLLRPRRGWQITVVLAAVAGIALASIAVNALSTGRLGSGAGSAALTTASGTGGSTALGRTSALADGPAPSPAQHIGPRVAARMLDPRTPSAATCAGPGDCFVVRVNTVVSCSTAKLVVEFFPSNRASKADRHETVTLPMTGAKYTDVAIDEPVPADVSASVAQSSCGRG